MDISVISWAYIITSNRISFKIMIALLLRRGKKEEEETEKNVK